MKTIGIIFMIITLVITISCGNPSSPNNLYDPDNPGDPGETIENGIYIGSTLYNNLVAAINASEGTEATIIIHSNFDRGLQLDPLFPQMSFAKFPDNTHITIEGKGAGKTQIHCTLYYNSPVHPYFKITANSSLTLKNIQLNGRSRSTILIAGGSFTMLDGVIIRGTEIDGGGGGGVYMESGTFTMKGGSISNNTVTATAGLLRTGQGGGVLMEGGTFIMEGGEITGNTATYIGGLYIRGGDFIMKGGMIHSNTSTDPGSSGHNLGLYIYNGVPQGTAVYGDIGSTPILPVGSSGTSDSITGKN